VRYLTLAAEYNGPPLRDDFDGSLEPEDIGLPPEVASKIRAWNARYQFLFPLSPVDRSSPTNSERIESLDVEGIALAKEITNVLGDVKVRYYSEGHLRHIWF